MENDVIETIEKLKEDIKMIDSQIGYVNSRIDTLECYRGNDGEIDELIEESNELEDKREKLVKQLKELEEKLEENKPLTKEEIQEKLEKLYINKDLLIKELRKLEENSDIQNPRYANGLFDLGSLSQTIKYWENELKKLNKPKRR